MQKLVMSLSIMAGLLMGAPVATAQDITPQMNEAAAFFAHLASSSDNPVIAAMAQENLQKLKTDSKTPANRVEVALVPQLDNTLAVTAVVNKRYMANFVVDTGAGYTVITPQMARDLGVEITDETQRLNITTANGVVKAPVVTLKHINLGGMEVRGVDAVVMDLGSDMFTSGLLGMNFFQGLELTVRSDKLILSRIGS